MKNFLILTVLFTLASCSVDENEKCTKYVQENVTEVNAPSTGKLNEPVEIEVEYILINGCGRFENFIETGDEKTRLIAVQAVYEGCICSQNIQNMTSVYRFIPSTVGQYELKFKSGPTEYITVNIEITE